MNASPTFVTTRMREPSTSTYLSWGFAPTGGPDTFGSSFAPAITLPAIVCENTWPLAVMTRMRSSCDTTQLVLRVGRDRRSCQRNNGPETRVAQFHGIGTAVGCDQRQHRDRV